MAELLNWKFIFVESIGESFSYPGGMDEGGVQVGYDCLEIEFRRRSAVFDIYLSATCHRGEATGIICSMMDGSQPGAGRGRRGIGLWKLARSRVKS